jgi:hypothetical protein
MSIFLIRCPLSSVLFPRTFPTPDPTVPTRQVMGKPKSLASSGFTPHSHLPHHAWRVDSVRGHTPSLVSIGSARFYLTL